jgi:tetratricopeptide (TPR) repeat protein
MLILLTLAVIGIVLFVHWPVLSAQAVSFDDEEAIISNNLIQHPSFDSVRRFFSEITLSSVVRGYYRPMTLTSFMFDWAMGGRPDNFRPFHRTSLVLHIGSTVLLILLCYQLFGNPWVAALTGLLFGLHPLTVEPIAWVMERKTVLAAFFAFAALCAYVRYTHSRRPAGWFVAALFFYLLSLLSKPTSTPLPLILLLIDHWPLRRLSKRSILEKIPFFILAGLFAALTMLCEQRVNPLSLPAKLSPLHLPLRLCYLATFYLAKLALPINLSSVYMLPNPLAITNPIVIAAVVGTILLIVGLFISRRYTPAFWVGTLIFYLGLAPTMGFVGYSWVSASDKYVYLPGVGLVLILAWLLKAAWSARLGRTLTLSAAALAAILLSLATRHYLYQWQTSERFIQYMLSLAPDSPELHVNMGSYYRQQKQYHQALDWFTKAIELKPRYAEAYCNRGNCYVLLGDHRRAIDEYSAALAIRPSHANALLNRGNAFATLGRIDLAVADLSRAIELRPNDPDIYFNRGQAYGMLGQYDKAAADFSAVIKLRPGDVGAYLSRSYTWTLLGRYDRAIEDCSRAIQLVPDDPGAYNFRAAALLKLGRRAEAAADLQRCLQLGGTPDPDVVDALKTGG